MNEAEMSLKSNKGLHKKVMDKLQRKAKFSSDADFKLTLVKGMNPKKLSHSDIESLKDMDKMYEADSSKFIKELIDTGWSGSNESQMKAVQLLKGLATSDDEEANEFMKKLDKFTSGMKVSESEDEEDEEEMDDEEAKKKKKKKKSDDDEEEEEEEESEDE